MTFTRVKPLNWAFGELLTSSQMNSLDTDHANAVDGAGGGTYPFTTDIGLTFTGTSNTVPPMSITGHGNAAGLEVDNDGSGVALHVVSTSRFEDVVHAIGDIDIDTAADARFSPTRTLTRQQDYFSAQNDGTWAFDPATRLWIQSSTSAGAIYFSLNNLIDKAELTAVTVTKAGKSDSTYAGHSALPTAGGVVVYKRSGTTVSTLGSASDTASPVATYDAAHDVSVSGLTEVINESHQYWVQVVNETGANAVANTTGVLLVTCTFIVDRVTPGG